MFNDIRKGLKKKGISPNGCGVLAGFQTSLLPSSFSSSLSALSLKL